MTVWLSTVLLTFLAPTLSAGAEDPNVRGQAIAREADGRDRGYGDSQVTVTMVLEDLSGNTRERRLNIMSLEARSEGEGDKSLVAFEEPRDIRGTALLTYPHIEGPDDQWLYLPALRRVKRIASVNKSGSFVGSEFAYEDISGQEWEKFDYLWLREEPCGAWECQVVERRPTYEDSGYSRLVTWYDQDEYRMQRIDFYDLDDELLKTLYFNDYRLYGDQYWRAHELVMENYKTRKSTRLIYEDYAFQSGFSENDFSQQSLTRIR